MILFNKAFRSVILDFDGVVADSNDLKAQNIYSAVLPYYPPQVAEEFTDLFIGLNGVPREEKIFNYFKDFTVAGKILERYNRLNAEQFNEVSYTDGFLPFLKWIKQNGVVIYILSGGDQIEVSGFLRHKGIDEAFEKIMGGPLNKTANLKTINVARPAVYFGDSLTDYEVSVEFALDFVFVYGYSQFAGWRQFFGKRNILGIIQNFKTLNYD